MTKEQIDFFNTKLRDIYSTIDSRELDGIAFSIRVKNENAYLYIESMNKTNETWNIIFKTRIKSLDHLDRLILSIKNLFKELE